MKYKYVVILKNEGEYATDLFSFLLCLASTAIFLDTAWGNAHPDYILLGFAALIMAGLVYNAIVRFRYRRRVRFRYVLLLTALGWFTIPFLPWVGLIFVLLSILEYSAKRPLEIGFHSDRVVINTLFRRRHDWSAFNNVLLRDGLLTLDFKNNRLLQKEILDDDDEDDADEEEFNAFCRERLAGKK